MQLLFFVAHIVIGSLYKKDWRKKSGEKEKNDQHNHQQFGVNFQCLYMHKIEVSFRLGCNVTHRADAGDE